LKGATGNYGKERQIFLTHLKIFGDAEFEDQSLKRRNQDIIVERDYKKTEWCKITTEFRQERFNL